MIEFDHVYKSYNTKAVLLDVSLTIEDGELFTLIGASGCGKTTLLKMINKLNTVDQGELRIDGKRIQDISCSQLPKLIGYVVQEGGLFPHLTVEENIELIMKSCKVPEDKINQRVDELLKLVNLDPEVYKNQYPSQLSGGQRQRVGVARAFAMDPGIILMDEPFSALDPVTRGELQDEVVKLQKKYKKTVIFVTHDMDEAIKIASRICFIQDGRIVQCDSPERILKNPGSQYIRDFIGKDRLWDNPEFIKAKDIMKPKPVTISQERTVMQAIQIMRNRNIDSLLVTNEEKSIKGIVRLEDLKDIKNYHESVNLFITDQFICVEEDTSFQNILMKLEERQYEHIGIIPVVDGTKKCVGFLTKSSLLSTLSRRYVPDDTKAEKEEKQAS